MGNTQDNRISVVINTYNAEKYLEKVLKSVECFDEIVVCDMESTDATLRIAEEYHCRIVTFKRGKNAIVEPARQFAIDAATYPWVLVVDADELVSPHLASFLYRKIAEPDCPDAIDIPRKNFFMGQFMHSSYPDHVLRFFRKSKAHWPPVIHTSPVVDGTIYKISKHDGEMAFVHLANDTVADIIRKNNVYSDYEVERRIDKTYNLWHLIVRPFFRVFKGFVLKGGYKDGCPGLIYAFLMGTYQLMIVAKIIEKRITKGRYE